MVVTEAMELISQSKDSQPLVPKEKAPMAKAEDFRLLPNGGGPKVNGDQPKVAGGGGGGDTSSDVPLMYDTDTDNMIRLLLNGDGPKVNGDQPKVAGGGDPSSDIPLMDDTDTDNKSNMKDQNNTDGVSITMPDSTDYNDNIPDEDGLDLRFNVPDDVDGAHPDDNADALEKKETDFNNVKHLTQGMMDVALLSANANQLRIVLESSHSHPYYISSIVLISASLICQVAVGVTLIMDYQYHITNQPQKARTVSRFSMLGIFLIIIINVFIAAFSVASPVVYRAPELTTSTTT